MQHTEDGELGKINRPPLVDQKHCKLPAHENSNLRAAR